MKNEFVAEWIGKINSLPKDISKFIKDERITMNYKGYGTPEVEIKFLHEIFLGIQAVHPEFKSFSWEQCNAFNDNYHHFQLMSFTVNDTLDVCSNIDFYFAYEESDEMTPGITLQNLEFPDPEEIAFAKENNLKHHSYGLDGEDLKAYWEYSEAKYKHLEEPCLKFLILLKMMEVHFSMYYYLYIFGNGVRVRFSEEEVVVTILDENEREGSPLNVGDGLDGL